MSKTAPFPCGLAALNTLSGRSYNDISQYPVFPWVLADYTSAAIDLADPAVYRDLSKPMGALNAERLDYLTERARAFEDPEMGIPKFLYGSHYSAGGTTLFWLLRLEPFTKLAIELQGGTFDHADRMFHSMATAWTNVCTGNQDFKELTPEFFHMPEFLLNLNGFNLGKTQKGETLGDVVLPPWAATAEQFVRINRAALESEHVSSQLHLWIDLIFGSKQNGPAAEEADNLFYYLTYEGAVDLEAFEDPRMRQATEEQILEYGQTPSQLMARKHPKRDVEAKSRLKGVAADNDETLWACFGINSGEQPVASIWAVGDGEILTLSLDRRVAVHRWMPFPNFQGAPFTFELDRGSADRRRVGAHFARDARVTTDSFALSTDGKVLLSCGHWDTTFKISRTDTGAELESVGQHKDIVTCICLGESLSRVVALLP